MEKNFQPLKRGLFIYSGTLILLGVFLLGWAIGNKQLTVVPKHSNSNPDYEKTVSGKNSKAPSWISTDSVDFEIFWQAWELIQNNFVDRPASESKLFYGALMGMVSALDDPYSLFLEPQQNDNFKEELKGRFEGIGAEIGIRENRLTIIAPLPESPAEKAGLKAGDFILFIDDLDTTNLPLDEAVYRIRGDKGTSVTLTIQRDEEEEPRKLSITRDTINVVPVTSSIKTTPNGKRIAYVKISNFHADSDTRFRNVVNTILAEGPDGFIIDVRNDPGGYLDQAINISDYWIPGGLIVVQEKFSENNTQAHLATGAAELGEFPTAVLINGGSASASEIFAGALRDHQKATLIGEKSFGKGSVQDVHEFPDGSAIKLTIARWLTPNGTEIDKQGILPDIEVLLSEEDFNAGRDPQLDKALEFFDKK